MKGITTMRRTKSVFKTKLERELLSAIERTKSQDFMKDGAIETETEARKYTQGKLCAYYEVLCYISNN
jgi:hypothetical protein